MRWYAQGQPRSDARTPVTVVSTGTRLGVQSVAIQYCPPLSLAFLQASLARGRASWPLRKGIVDKGFGANKAEASAAGTKGKNGRHTHVQRRIRGGTAGEVLSDRYRTGSSYQVVKAVQSGHSLAIVGNKGQPFFLFSCLVEIE